MTDPNKLAYILVFMAMASVVIGLPLIIMLIVRLVRRGKEKATGKSTTTRKEQMHRLADKFGLEFLGGEDIAPPVPGLGFIAGKMAPGLELTSPIRLEGKYQDHDLKIYEHLEHRGSRQDAREWTAASITGPNPKGLTFEFSASGVINKVREIVGSGDIKIGDKRFDDLLTVKTNDPEFIKWVMLGWIKERFFDIWETRNAKGTLTLDGEDLLYEELCIMRDDRTRERFKAIVELLCELRGVIMSYNR